MNFWTEIGLPNCIFLVSNTYLYLSSSELLEGQNSGITQVICGSLIHDF